MDEKYHFDEKRKALYLETCEKGIGWNVPYAQGTFITNKEGKRELAQEKAKKLYHDFMSKHIIYITIEGGVRGGKDVYGLYCWANYLMVCPNKLHLATGMSSQHALQTMLESDGFGLKYLLPHGEELIINNTKMFRFMDFYGQIKTIMFYAGADKDDYKAFHGFNFGSCYENEAINQNIATINEAKNRIIASKWPKLIHTQNPQAGSFSYYTDYENLLTVKPYQLEEIQAKKDEYQKTFKRRYLQYKAKQKEGEAKVLEVIYQKTGYHNFDEIKNTPPIFQKYSVLKRDVSVRIERSFIPALGTQYLDFNYTYLNPNNVNNGLDFRYFHFTLEDNLALTEVDKERVRSNYDTSSILYRREIEGIRASSDNAIWDTFTNANILQDDIPTMAIGDRYLVIDYGMKNAFVCADCEIEPKNGFTVKIWKEYRFDGRKNENNKSQALPTDELYYQKVKEMIEGRNGGRYLYVIIDPSATSMINLLKAKGIAVKKAQNAVGTRNLTTSSEYGKVDKSLTGIWLVRDGFARKKIFIHESCSEGINEVVGYSLDSNQLALGIEKPLKINDHFPDVIRYLVNTTIKDVRRWL